MSNEETFEVFGSTSFQSKIILALVSDPTYAQQVVDIVDPEFFTTIGHSSIFDFIKTSIEKEASFPSLDVVDYWYNGLEDGTIKEAVNSTLKEIKESDLRDLQFVKDRGLEFCRNQAMKNAILKSADLLERGDFESIHKIIEDATLAGKENEIGHDYWQDIHLRNQKLSRKPIPTGLGEGLDRILGGGVAPGELAVILAPTGVGKSMALVNVAAGAISQGLNVVYYTLELSEAQVGVRMDARVCNMGLEEVRKKPHVVSATLDKKRSKFGKLIIKQFPTKQATVTSLKAHISKLRTMKFAPDLVIVDYADLLRATRSYGEKRHELESLYEDLRGIAVEMHVPMWTASQSNRGSMQNEIVTLSDVSESFAKVQVADFVISIQRMLADKKENRAKFFIAKSRGGRDGITMEAIFNTEAVYVEALATEDGGVWYDQEETQEMMKNNGELDRKERLRRRLKGVNSG